MKRNILTILASLTVMGLMANRVLAHCQIPCGIYNDEARFVLLEEHVTTIEKSINEIQHLSKDHDRPNHNQLVRWVQNKEDHATQLTDIVTFYFMAQRVKPAEPENKTAHAKYVREITLLHQMLVHAMKAKQTTDLKNVEELRSLVKQFKQSYLGTK